MLRLSFPWTWPGVAMETEVSMWAKSESEPSRRNAACAPVCPGKTASCQPSGAFCVVYSSRSDTPALRSVFGSTSYHRFPPPPVGKSACTPVFLAPGTLGARDGRGLSLTPLEHPPISHPCTPGMQHMTQQTLLLRDRGRTTAWASRAPMS